MNGLAVALSFIAFICAASITGAILGGLGIMVAFVAFICAALMIGVVIADGKSDKHKEQLSACLKKGAN